MGNTKVEVKGIEFIEGPDGYAYNANVYVNKQKTASIHDRGFGGNLEIHVVDEDRYALIVEGIADLTWDCPWSDETFPMTMDVFLGELAEDCIIKKQARGHLLTQTPDGNLHEWKIRFSTASPEKHEEGLAKAGLDDHKVVNHTLGTKIL